MNAERKIKEIPSVEIIERLYERLTERKDADPSVSYTAKIFSEGVIKIAQKVGEEGVETALAAVAQSNEELIEESADLLYMLVLLWLAKGIEPKEVFLVLEERFGKPALKKNL